NDRPRPVVYQEKLPEPWWDRDGMYTFCASTTVPSGLQCSAVLLLPRHALHCRCSNSGSTTTAVASADVEILASAHATYIPSLARPISQGQDSDHFPQTGAHDPASLPAYAP